MPLSIDYLLAANATPAVRVPSGYLDPNAADPVPVVSRAIAPGAVGAGSLSTPFNSLGVRIDNLARYGGGGYAIAEGLAISEGTGLQAVIQPGVILSDGHQVVTARDGSGNPIPQTQALTASVTSYLWALRTGVLASPVIGSLAPPTPTAVYLGRMVTSGSAPTAIDRSGVLEKRFSLLFRRTGDAAAPNDTPPAGIILLTLTAGGLYLWDGLTHVHLNADLMLPLAGGTLEGDLIIDAAHALITEDTGHNPTASFAEGVLQLFGHGAGALGTSIVGDGYGSGSFLLIRGRKAAGTKAAPTATQADQILVEVDAVGHDGSGFAAGIGGAAILIKAAENYDATHQGGYLSFQVAPKGDTVRAEVAQLSERGFRLPRLTTTQRDAVASPAEGNVIHNLTSHKLNFYDGSAWREVTSA